ncbi:MAG: hypothetical protein K2Y56_14590 [Methylobacterium sp.]|uniref:hypothetical protein n=1 Tax=Methylobacterium sp. TaxID=409 RepID=UPI0025DAEDB9|nr:hypothetical protein [Methylobacterium sp.]MBX9932746.1 hypothetical protein [Methylobacterium sp.]
MTGHDRDRACPETSTAETALDEALRRSFWQRLHHDALPPMLALQIAAGAIGTLYRQLAEAHRGPGGCACGWEPDPDGDLIILEARLASAIIQSARHDLARMPAAGRA